MSSDGSNKLVRMANQIADNFDFGSDRDMSVAGVADHLARFWTLDMKQAICEQSRNGDIGLNDIAAAAVESLADTLDEPA